MPDKRSARPPQKRRVPPPKRKRRRARKPGIGFWTLIILLALIAAYVAVLEMSRPHVEGDNLRFNRYVDLVELGRVKSAKILNQDSVVVGSYLKGCDDDTGSVASRPSSEGHSHSGGVVAAQPAGDETCPGGRITPYFAKYLKQQGSQERLIDLLIENRVPIDIDQQFAKSLVGPATLLLPTLMLVVIFVYFIISYRKGSGIFGVRSGARRIEGSSSSSVTFADVAGQEAAVQQLRDIKEYLTDPQRFLSLGAKIPKGVLLYGPPGCGKTLLARALAGEANSSFYTISGSDFVEMYVGVGAARVRDLFKEARENSPAIIFIDELDSIGRRRGIVDTQGSTGEQEQALNQLLAEMDGFSPTQGIILLGATNRPDVLDPALLRPGRFDRTVGLEKPDEKGRAQILGVHAADKKLDASVDLKKIAKNAVGLSGADLASVMNEAALLTARARKPAISQTELEQALKHVIEAPERQRELSMRDRNFGRASTEERVTFADVAGVDEAITELAEVRDYLTSPEKYVELGARPPRGFLLVGPPGCGKTLLAKAVAGEANAAFFSVAATEFVEVFVGEGAARVRDLFAEAKSVSPAIIFIDEIDAIGARRGASPDGHRERESTLNQMLIEMDGFRARDGVIVMAASNRPDILDPALVRPGRFDRTVTLGLPDREGRRQILGVHAKGKNFVPGLTLDTVAGLTPGFSGAELANVLNEAALLTARKGLPAITMDVVEEAIDRVGSGIARSHILSEEERRLVAYHESGHVLVGLALPGAQKPHKVSIIPKGRALGVTRNLDEADRLLYSRSVLLDRMAGILGGRVAEQIVFGEPSSGAADDLVRVDQMARQMVRDLGMSETLGPQAFAEGIDAQGWARGYSEETSREIDNEVKKIVGEAQERARAVLTGMRAALDRIAGELLERETLTFDEIAELAGPIPKFGAMPNGKGRPAPPNGRRKRPAKPAPERPEPGSIPPA